MDIVRMVVNAFSKISPSQRSCRIFVVIERSPEMLFWEQTIHSFIFGLRQTHFFCSVHVFGLSVEKEPFLLDCAGRVVPISFLSDQNDLETFVCILTTGVNFGWSNGSIMRFFMSWVTPCHVVIGQMLSSCRWKYTAIGESDLHCWRTAKLRKFKFSNLSWWLGDYVPAKTEYPDTWHLVQRFVNDSQKLDQLVPFVPIPIFDINEEETFFYWVKSFFACRGRACGVMLNLLPVATSVPTPKKRNEAYQIVEDFAFSNSSFAFHVATLSAAIVGDFSVSDLLLFANCKELYRKEFSGVSPAEACTEFLFSGLIKWVNGEHFDTHQPRFTFRDEEVRFELEKYSTN